MIFSTLIKFAALVAFISLALLGLASAEKDEGDTIMLGVGGGGGGVGGGGGGGCK